MTETPLDKEILDLCEQLASTEDEDVRGPAEVYAREYRERAETIRALYEVDCMVHGEGPAVERTREDRLQVARRELRDKLRHLLAWARGSGRLPPHPSVN